ncbi:MAG TPA: hypothetical protein VJ885_18890, partial [Thermoanaerobaculia bacterium]|nr:hypothetical protein [Thermoanaerobaculia bacterium]
MDALRSRAASAPSGLSSMARRLGGLVTDFDDRLAVRLGVGAAAGLVAGLVDGWSAPALGACAGLLLGWPGLAAFALVQLLTAWPLLGGFLTALVLVVASAVPGAACYLIFSSIPDLGRGLPNLRSHLWLLGSALLGGLVGGLLMAMATDGSASVAFWSWVAGSLSGMVLVGPPLLLAMDRFFRPFMVPIPGELPARRSRRLSIAPEVVESRGEETVLVAPVRKPDLARGLMIGGAVILGLTAVAVPVSSLLPEGGPWVLLVYLVPILGAALDYGLRGGI